MSYFQTYCSYIILFGPFCSWKHVDFPWDDDPKIGQEPSHFAGAKRGTQWGVEPDPTKYGDWTSMWHGLAVFFLGYSRCVVLAQWEQMMVQFRLNIWHLVWLCHARNRVSCCIHLGASYPVLNSSSFHNAPKWVVMMLWGAETSIQWTVQGAV